MGLRPVLCSYNYLWHLFSGNLMKRKKDTVFHWCDEDVNRIDEIFMEIGLTGIHLRMEKENFQKIVGKKTRRIDIVNS